MLGACAAFPSSASLHLNVVVGEQRSRRLAKLRQRFGVVGARRYIVPLGCGQIALRLNDQEDSRFTELEFLLLRAEGLLVQHHRLVCRVNSRPGLNYGDLGIADVLFNLVFLRWSCSTSWRCSSRARAASACALRFRMGICSERPTE